MKNIEQIIDKLEQQIKEMFFNESSGHDMYHLKRVLNLALHIQKKEGGDRLVIAVVALLHDIHRIIQKETGRFCSPKDSLSRVKEILKKVDLSEEKINNILHCIEFHGEYFLSEKGKTVQDIEISIIQDADSLDAIGAIGIARVFSYGGVHNIPIWVPEKPLSEGDWKETGNKSPSQIHHFYERLLKVKDNMNTKTGKKMARNRHKVLEGFLKEFFGEWEGKK